jgi:N-acetylmuramoyl-L-alanine amidase
MIICLDPGHGGHDPGAVGTVPFTVKEKDVVLGVARLLRNVLTLQKHQVLMTRADDTFVPVDARAEVANKGNADLFVSIHCNSFTSSGPNGWEVYHRAGDLRSAEIAAAVINELNATFPERNSRGVKTAGFAVLRYTRMPAILVELEFLSNPGALVWLADETQHAPITQALARAIAAAHGTASPSPPPPTSNRLDEPIELLARARKLLESMK